MFAAVGGGHAVEEQAVSKFDSVDPVCVPERTIRTAVGCCSVLFDRVACWLGHTCSAGETQTLKPLLVDWEGEIDVAEHFQLGWVHQAGL